jgi:long-chain acyl-CoA synthetase
MTAADRPATLPQAFQRTARIGPDVVALRTVGDAQTLMWRDYAARVCQVAAGLAALGIGRGDAVALMMANRIEFYPLEVGAQHVGATSLSVYTALAAEQLTRVFVDSATKLVFCEKRHVDRIKATDAEIDIIVCIDGCPRARCRLTTSLLAGHQISISSRGGWRCSPTMSRR